MLKMDGGVKQDHKLFEMGNIDGHYLLVSCLGLQSGMSKSYSKQFPFNLLCCLGCLCKVC